jgi:hypothetical protein
MLASLLAAGPATATASEMPSEQSTDACQTSQLATLLGQDATGAIILKARQLSGAKTVRVIEPGAMVTMDFRTDRLNVELGKNNKIIRFRCG